ncbi:MAG: Zinc-regulated TonB-dependent outer membrane receptor [uncultured Sulfurovum sp.]|uniref:Zinc-regulated TonB-dependent outer membrane receptor n=1 Tax=uncultured Sulfurovum sp. TaxID=269237 RepID=A0A6S6TYY1_9BACT|nr:MAG: Zinc-regulated TonB-dependent outer membrane receptor [uncultured Sulfurovum sp.]
MKKILLLSVATASLLVGSSIEELQAQLTKQQETINLLQTKLEQLVEAKASENASTAKTIKKEATKKEVLQDKMRDIRKPLRKKKASSSFAQQAFMPDISLIGDLSYVDRKNDTTHTNMPGLTHAEHGDDDGHSHNALNGDDGFNLNYAELVLQSTVDPYVDMTAVFHLTDSDFEIEELYANSRGLPNGLGLKVGKFFSNFGRLNAQHHHVWNFADQPLVNNAFLGEHGLNEKGLALNWLAPTPFYLDLGVEVLKGSNEYSFGDAAITLTEDVGVAKVSAPNLKVAYAKVGADVGDVAVLGGLSYADGDARLNHLTDEEDPHAFAGSSKIYGADLTLKKPLGAYSDLTWTTEYMKRELDGTQYAPNTAKDAWASQVALSKEQSGYYSSLIYKMDKDWRMGLRYDDILSNDVVANGTNKNLSDDMNRYSAMVEYNFSEFNRLRLQYNKDNSKFNEDGAKIKNDEIMLQLNMAIGSHGAHSF